MLQSNDTSNNDFHTWYQLKPDSVGSYVNGSLSYLTSIPQTPTYNPLDYASAVLADGRVVIQGGEYNYGNQTDHQLGYIYQPTDGSWTPLSPPNGWSEMWDDPSVVLSDGRFMEGQVDCPGCGSMLAAIYDPSGGTWTATGTGKWDKNNEEGWTLLPDRTVLTVDTKPQDYNYYQIYDPGTGAWTHPGTTPLGCITLIAGR